MNSSKIFKNILQQLKKSHIDSAEIDALILLEFVTKKSREFLLANPEFELSEKQIIKLNNLVGRRKSHEPIAYITGHKEFFGLDFFVSPDVLIPRPETEQLVEATLEFIVARKEVNILDVGTGCGNIIISLAKNANADYSASDISKEVLDVARKNAEKHQVKINFIQSNLFENIHKNFDVIIANLPYVPADNSVGKGIKYEPQTAIFAEDNGTAIIKEFLNDAQKYIKKDGLILVELDPRNANFLKDFAQKIFIDSELILISQIKKEY